MFCFLCVEDVIFAQKKKKDERDKNLPNRIDQIYRRENI